MNPGAKRRFRPTEAPRLAVQSPGSALRGPGGCPTVPLTPIALRKRQLCPAGLGTAASECRRNRPWGRFSPATYSVSAVYSDTATPPPPTSTFHARRRAAESVSFRTGSWDIMKVVSKNTGSPSAANSPKPPQCEEQDSNLHVHRTLEPKRTREHPAFPEFIGESCVSRRPER